MHKHQFICNFNTGTNTFTVDLNVHVFYYVLLIFFLKAQQALVTCDTYVKIHSPSVIVFLKGTRNPTFHFYVTRFLGIFRTVYVT